MIMTFKVIIMAILSHNYDFLLFIYFFKCQKRNSIENKLNVTKILSKLLGNKVFLWTLYCSKY